MTDWELADLHRVNPINPEPTMTDAEIVARMRKAAETWSDQAAGMRMTAANDLARMNIADAIRIGQEAVVLEALAAFLLMCFRAD
jgi:hypothetical protein